MDRAYVKVIGTRLRSAREGRGLSLREFAKELKEDFTLLARIEQGERYPPRRRLETFAKALSLTQKQLEALIAVERRGLNPYELLPEIPPAHISHESIQGAAEGVLNKYCRAVERSDVDLPVPVDAVLNRACRLSTEYCDFKKERIPGRSGVLYGCLYPDGVAGRDRVIFVNTAPIRGHKLSPEVKRTTIAHEAGHYVLHCGNKDSAQLFFRFTKGPTFCRRAECEESLFDPLENQASVFAACLLMPRKHFMNRWQELSGSVAGLAQYFGVTERFVRSRARMLGCE